MNIYLIRHGETEANVMNKEKYTMFTGQYDTSLTQNGEAQALRLFDKIGHLRFDRVFSSDLSRAVNTAEIIFPKMDIHKTSLLRERSLGVFEGKRLLDISTKEEYKKFFSDCEYKDFKHSFVTKAPQGESYTDVMKRVKLFFSNINLHDFDNVAIVSHAITMKCILKFLLNLSEEETLKLKINNCEPIKLINEEGIITREENQRENSKVFS
ncbi:histidine phosphatase family protein [Bacillus spongiae]|uniref:phosphoglycerate mutase (2,3-diphosphoglycerate-dependent) n=1 Tax=Bacillus spongiae TaxID=2683610 RepID=A0ABU8HHB0_9BACI